MAALASSSPCTSILPLHTSKNHNPWLPNSISGSKQTKPFDPFLISAKGHRRKSQPRRRLTVVAVTEGSAKNSSKSEESIPSWAKPDSDETPPWARDEAASQTGSQQGFEVPFFVYLLASAITAIAAIGSVFEYLNQKPVFGVVNPDSIFYVPLLGFFVFTGIPSSAFLWFKSVETANKEAEEQDRRDGYK